LKSYFIDQIYYLGIPLVSAFIDDILVDDTVLNNDTFVDIIPYDVCENFDNIETELSNYSLAQPLCVKRSHVQ